MLLAAGAAAVIAAEGVVIYKQGNEISKLKDHNEKLSKELDLKLQKVVDENQKQINELKVKIDIEIEEKRELAKENEKLIKSNEALSNKITEGEKKREAERHGLLSLISRKDKKIDEMMAQNQELLTRVNALLGLPGIRAVIERWNEAGDMYSSNCIESTHQTNLQEVHNSNNSNTTQNLIDVNDGTSSTSYDELNDDIVVISTNCSPGSVIEDTYISSRLAISKK